MVSRTVALSAILGFILFASVLVVPPTPTDTYAVTAQPLSEATNVPESFDATDATAYENLTADYQQAFDAARANNGTKQYTGETYPDGLAFPDQNGLFVRAINYQDAAYVMEFTKKTQGLTLRTVVSVIGGLGLLGYAGYRYSQPKA